MTEALKSLIRTLVYPFAMLIGGEIAAKTGTLKFKILLWLYGPDSYEQTHTGWIYPDRNEK